MYDFEIKEGKQMIRCNSICSRFENEKVIGFDKDQKYCGLCQYYITTIARLCSCCHSMFRTKRRNNKRRQGGVWNEKIKFELEKVQD